MLIELRDVKKSYTLPKISIDVLKGITLDINKGEFVAVMGPSGSGKSTLLNIIGCLDRLTSGQYLLEGMDVGDKSDNDLAVIRSQKMGFVFQSFNLLPKYPAWKNVQLPLVYSGVPAAERKTRAMEFLRRVGIAERAEHSPAELSGGEQQRVAIARALINKPEIILADEPTGNLDSRSGGEIMEIFKGLNREGITLVMVTHEQRLAEMADRLITIRDGICNYGCF